MSRFSVLEGKLAKKGIKNPGGLAYKIGVKKYGKKGMAMMAKKGKEKAEGMKDSEKEPMNEV